MKNRKKQIRRTATAATVVALLLLSMSFFADGMRTGGDTEMVESAYGRAMFGGRFGWLDSVKRPGINAGVNTAGILGFNFSGDPSLADRILDPSTDIQSLISPMGVASVPGLSLGGNRYPGGIPGLVRHEQVNLGYVSFYSDDDDDDSRFTEPEEKDPNDPDDGPEDPVVVPAPGAVSLALIGLAAISAVRKRRIR